MGLQELKADAKLLREGYAALKDSSTLDPKHELAENILPLFEGLCDAIQELNDELADEVADQGEALDELVDQTGDVLHPETSTKILGVIEIGKVIAHELEALLAKGDDVTKKRVRALIKTYRQGAEVINEIIAEITMPLDPEEPGDMPPGEVKPGEGDPDGDEDDEDDDDEDEDEDDLAHDQVKP